MHSALVAFFFQKHLSLRSPIFSSVYFQQVVSYLKSPLLSPKGPSSLFQGLAGRGEGLEIDPILKNLERRQLIAHKKEETGHPDTFSGENLQGNPSRDGKNPV